MRKEVHVCVVCVCCQEGQYCAGPGDRRNRVRSWNRKKGNAVEDQCLFLTLSLPSDLCPTNRRSVMVVMVMCTLPSCPLLSCPGDDDGESVRWCISNQSGCSPFVVRLCSVFCVQCAVPA